MYVIYSLTKDKYIKSYLSNEHGEVMTLTSDRDKALKMKDLEEAKLFLIRNKLEQRNGWMPRGIYDV